MSEHPLKQSLVRIRGEDGEVLGCGFLVSRQHVLTCAHVVDQAETDARRVYLDFPFSTRKESFPAWVAFRLPGQRVTGYPPPDGLDLALLTLQKQPPEDVRPARLMLPPELWGHDFRAIGFPEGHDNGVFAVGTLRDTQASGWAQLDAPSGTYGYFVAPGFSGGPVWDEQVGGIVGMVVAADEQTGVRAAFMIPTAMLLAACPQLAAEIGQEVMGRNNCLLLRPEVSSAAGREQQRDDIENILLPAVEQAKLRLPDEGAHGVEVKDISFDLIQLVDQAGIVVVDANCYESDSAHFKLSPYLYYILALSHIKANSTILVTRSDHHLPVSFRQKPHTLIYSVNRPTEFFRGFRAVVQRIQMQADENPDNPILEYARVKILQAQVNSRNLMDASKADWGKFLSGQLEFRPENDFDRRVESRPPSPGSPPKSPPTEEPGKAQAPAGEIIFTPLPPKKKNG